MKVYEAVFKEGETEGVYALSVVENPAMQDLWISLSEQPQNIELAEVDEEKRLLLGAALIPNKKIYRNIDGNEFYLTFSEETIEKLAHNFLKNQNNNNSSLEHDVKLDDMSVVEAWTVQDPNNDKSNAFGKTYEKGTWVTMMKVDNDEIWGKVKSGDIKGFSIDALLGLQEINLKTEIKMTNEVKDSIVSDVLNGVKAFFSNKDEKEEVALEEEVYATKEELTELKTMVEEIKAMLEPKEEKEEEKEKEEILMTKDSVLAEKDKEIESLKAELSKQPEVDAVKPNLEVANVELTKQGKILELMRKNK